MGIARYVRQLLDMWRRQARAAWRVGDVLALSGPKGEAAWTVVAVDKRHSHYLLARGAWPRTGAELGIGFAELAELEPKLVRHLDIG